MKKKHRQSDNSLEKWKEWQEHQYDPGYYTGGTIPPCVDIPSKTSLFGKLYKIGARGVGTFYIVLGIALIIMTAVCATVSLNNDHEIGNIIGALVFIFLIGGLGFLFILSGRKYIRNVRSKSIK